MTEERIKAAEAIKSMAAENEGKIFMGMVN